MVEEQEDMLLQQQTECQVGGVYDEGAGGNAAPTEGQV